MLKRLLVGVLIVASTPAFAQKQPEPSETTEKFGAWTVRCVAQQGDGEDRACEVFLAIQGQGGPIAQIAFGRSKTIPDAVAVVRTPLGVLVSQPASVAPGEANQAAIELAFATCLANGCIAQTVVPADRLGNLTAGKTAALSFAERTGRAVTINIPLDGLTDALTRIGLVCDASTCRVAE